MLVLTRKLNDSITINQNIIIKILHINKYNIKIGIDAPKNVIISRSEIINKNKNLINKNK